MHQGKRWLSGLLASVLTCSFCAQAVQVVTEEVTLSDAAASDNGAGSTAISEFQFKYPAKPTFEQINQYFIDHPYDVNKQVTYDVEPDIGNKELNEQIASGALPFTTDKSANDTDEIRAIKERLAGVLSQETLENALNAVNFMRYHAGVKEVTIDPEKQIRTQASAALLSLMKAMTHYPAWEKAQEVGISQPVYQWANRGAGESNGVAGSDLPNKLVNSFMPDPGNDGTGLAHRAYVLNPTLQSTGFGAANITGSGAVFMHVTWTGNDPDRPTAVMWPSAKQPLETFKTSGPADNPYRWNPWSFYLATPPSNAAVNSEKLKVTLESEGKETEVLATATEKDGSRIFTKGSYGMRNVIVFRPYNTYGPGDKVKVTIEGIEDSQGLPVPVSYDVHFFSTGTVPYPNLEVTSVDRSAAEQAQISLDSDGNGTVHYVVMDAGQTAPSADEVLKGTETALTTGSVTLDLTDMSSATAKTLYYVTTSATGADKDWSTANSSGERSDVLSINIPSFIVPPTARTLTYNGTAQALIERAADATALQYRLGDTGDYSTDIPTATKAGDYTVYYKLVGDDSGVAEHITVTIQKATAEITAKSHSIYVKAQAPDLSKPEENTHYTVAGLIEGDTLSGAVTMQYQQNGESVTPDTTVVGTYDIVISEVSDSNYAIVTHPGKLTIEKRPSSSSLRPSATTTTTTNTATNSDGSTTTTVTNPTTGVVTATTKKADGSTVTVETQKDGAVTTTEKTASGTTGIVTKNSTGQITEVKSTVSAAAITQAEKTGETVTLPVEISAANNISGAPAVKIDLSAGVKNLKVNIPVTDATSGTVAVIVKEDGTEEIVKNSIAGKNSVVLNIEGSTTLKIVDNSKKFGDVHSANHWAGNAIDFVSARGMFAGTGAETFSPDATTTRAQLLTVLARFDGYDTTGGDVWYAKGVEWATKNGVSDGSNPDASITREQLASILWRYAGSPESSHTLDAFTDAGEISTYAQKALAWANENGIMNGYGNGALDPKGEATRAQVAQMLMSFVTNQNS